MANDQCTLHVWGDFACFSRPELKVERFSYPIITPSAARGVFDAIYCKPRQFWWQITRIEMLAPPSYIALRRNEVDKTAPSPTTIGSWARATKTPSPLFADEGKHRQQRQTMALRDPAYRLHARLTPRPGFEGQRTAFRSQFRRRAERGKCFQQPYLGCREFAAYFRLVDHPDKEPPPTDHTQDVGVMLYDVFDLSRQNDTQAKPFVSVFHASIERGVLDVPSFESDDVLKPPPQEGRTI